MQVGGPREVAWRGDAHFRAAAARSSDQLRRVASGGLPGPTGAGGVSRSPRIRFEQFLPICSLYVVRRLTKPIALIILALWSLAAMHCRLEVLPGFDFLKSCCFAGSASSAPKDCESDGCGAVEDGGYRAEEQTASAPQPLLVLAVLFAVVEATRPELQACSLVTSESPPEIPKIWQFSLRAALPVRAPSLAS